MQDLFHFEVKLKILKAEEFWERCLNELKTLRAQALWSKCFLLSWSYGPNKYCVTQATSHGSEAIASCHCSNPVLCLVLVFSCFLVFVPFRIGHNCLESWRMQFAK